MLLDVANSGDRNVIKKGSVKVLKYKDLKTDIQDTWSLKAKAIPIIEASGTISKSFRQYPSNIPGKHEINGLHKTAIWGTCTHTAESANVKV
jgi:hypothetical protein